MRSQQGRNASAFVRFHTTPPFYVTIINHSRTVVQVLKKLKFGYAINIQKNSPDRFFGSNCPLHRKALTLKKLVENLGCSLRQNMVSLDSLQPANTKTLSTSA